MTQKLLDMIRSVPDSVTVRDVTLEGSRNMRDLGGWKTKDGKTIRFGEIFRSDDWSRLTESDRDQLSRMDIKTVVDFRATGEIRKAPDRLPGPENPELIHLPAFRGNPAGGGVFFLFRHRKRFDKWLVKNYIEILNTKGEFFCHVAETVASPQKRPLVLHCAAGKDRTGLAAALLLLLLGVHESDVITEYSLTNRAVDRWLEEEGRTVNKLRFIGFNPYDLIPLVAADPIYLEEALAHLRQTWGTAEDYLVSNGLTPRTVESLKTQLLF